MSYRINTNNAANFANMYSQMTQTAMKSSLEKLSSGSRINRAADDSAGMAIANQLRSQSNGLLQANKNANDAIGLVQIADGALGRYQEILVEVRDKSLQASSDTASVEARTAIAADVTALLEEADRISKNTQYNGISLLDGTFTNKKFQVGSEAGQTLGMSITNTDIASQGIDAGSLDLTTQAGAEAAIGLFDTAITSLDGIRSSIGSTQIALESRIRVNSTTQVNVAAAESQIRDVDYALESANFDKLSILSQAGSFALSQASAQQQQVLRLLQ